MIVVTFIHHGAERQEAFDADPMEIAMTSNIYNKTRQEALEILARNYLSIKYGQVRIVKVEEK